MKESDFPRLIEHAFPLKQASLDSVHEKNVRHGHISTLHIWPARRPLAACRAALIATLLPDPSAEPKPAGMSDEAWQQEIARKRREFCEKIGGTIEKIVDKNGRVKEITRGGVLHWHGKPKKKGDAEIIRQQAEDLEWFREEIRKVYGRAPKVLDPFAGGGAIPLEAMRLGCEATAMDINPVAWFILKCTLEYPQKLAGQTRPLPEFILHDDAFMRSFFAKAKGYAKSEVASAIKRLHKQLKKKTKDGKDAEPGLPFGPDEGEADELHADLAWHVRAWGQWVLAEARKKLAKYYPVYADFEPLKKGYKSYETRPMQFVPLADDGTPDIDALNDEFSEEYLENKQNPRWVTKPTVAYLWARTVQCKNCRAMVPLLKTRWLCKKDKKRVLLTMQPNAELTGVEFGIETNVPVKGGNAAQRREHDRRMSEGTMTRAGSNCPCCTTIMTMQDIRVSGMNSGLGFLLLTVVVDSQQGKEYRVPHNEEIAAAAVSQSHADGCSAILAGLGERFEPASTRSISAQLYGVRTYRDLFTQRQQHALAQIGASIQAASTRLASAAHEWQPAIISQLCLAFDRLLSFTCVNVRWKTDAEAVVDAFARFSISLLWDFAEAVPTGHSAGCWALCYERIATALDALAKESGFSVPPVARCISADELSNTHRYDVILTDPPYYQAISYADLADFFYVWLRHVCPQRPPEFSDCLTEKKKEIVQHVREDKDRAEERNKYEERMSAAFRRSRASLSPTGRFVIVFAHKDPEAWGTLVSAIINSGFVVVGSWPIATEMESRQRAASVASLASSVWLVCQPRPETAGAGWDTSVLDEMRANITIKLRDFWDAGIRGPDFIWAATGPALEAYSKYPVVKKADGGGVMSVSEFLNHVRRLVVDYIVGQVLSGGVAGDADIAAADRLDEPSAYYLLHRNDFGVDEAPAGAVILYATACGVSDRELMSTWDILAAGKGKSSDEEEKESDPDEEAESEGDSGAKVKLKTWAQRKGKSMGYEAPGGKPVPLIDRIHRLMHLWKAGDVRKVDEYIDDNGLRRHELFKRVLQSLIELSQPATEERSVLESISNHIGIRGVRADVDQSKFEFESSEVS